MNMETKEVKLYVQAHKYTWDDEFKIVVSTAKPLPDAATVVIQLSEVMIDVQIPTVNLKTLQLAEVEQLRETIKTERANSYARITAIEEKIQSLLCIEQRE
jgi:hypothetical protein